MNYEQEHEYFEAVERHFCLRRRKLAMLSPRDWNLVGVWVDAKIPLEAVIRGIDEAFDKHCGGMWRPENINSLAYCEQAVLAECMRMKEARVGSNDEN